MSTSTMPITSGFSPSMADSEVQLLRARVQAHIQARMTAGERYSETKLAREAGIAQQTLNDFLRCKTNSVTRLTRIKLTDFLDAQSGQPRSSQVDPYAAAAAAMPPGMLPRVSPAYDATTFAQMFLASSPAFAMPASGRFYATNQHPGALPGPQPTSS
jgi:hypothetical protein